MPSAHPPNVQFFLALMATVTRGPTGFASVDPPAAWPPTRSAPRPARLERGVETLPGIGQALARRLARLGLRTVGDLLLHRPHRYEEAAPERPIRDLFGEEEVAIAGNVVRASSRRTARRLTVQNVRVRDESGEIDAVWFNQPWVADRLTPGTEVRLRGSLSRRGGFAVKAYDVGDARATADYAPVYPATEDVTPQRLRGLVEAALARRRRGPRTRSRPRSGRTRACPSAATPWSRSTGRATSTRPRRGADASPSTSCSCSSSRSRAGPASARPRSRPRSASRAS